MASYRRGREGTQCGLGALDAKIAALEAKRAAKPEVDAPYSDIDLPPAVIKAVKAAFADDKSIKRMEAQYRGLDGFIDHSIKTHFPTPSE